MRVRGLSEDVEKLAKAYRISNEEKERERVLPCDKITRAEVYGDEEFFNRLMSVPIDEELVEHLPDQVEFIGDAGRRGIVLYAKSGKRYTAEDPEEMIEIIKKLSEGC